MCRQVLRLTITLIFARSILNRWAISFCVKPFLYIARISRTSLSVSLFAPFAEPCEFLPRPFCSRSRLFSEGEPRNKWCGFTHFLLSQLWSTQSPGAIVPKISSALNLAARVVRRSTLNRAYPSSSKPDFHSQHAPGAPTETLLQKRAAFCHAGSFLPLFFPEPVIGIQ